MKKCQHRFRDCINIKFQNGIICSYDIHCLECDTILSQIDNRGFNIDKEFKLNDTKEES